MACAVEKIGETVATIDSNIETPVITKGIVKSEVGNDADTILFEGHLLLEVGIVATKTVVGEVRDGIAQRGEIAFGAVSTLFCGVFTAEREVKRCANTQKESPTLAHRGTPEQLDRDVKIGDSLMFSPVLVYGRLDVLDTVVIIGVLCGSLGTLGEVIENRGTITRVLSTDADTKMLAEEVGVMQLPLVSKTEGILAVDSLIGEGIQTATHIVADIVAVLVHLSMQTKTKSQQRDYAIINLWKTLPK